MTDVTREAEGDGPTPTASRVPELVFAAGMVALGVWTFAQTTTIRIPGSVNALGPRAFPYATAGALVIAGLTVLRAVWRGDVGRPEDTEDLDVHAPTDWVTVAQVTASFLAHVVLVRPLGWGLAGAVLFAGTAWALGARWSRAVGVALVLGLAVHLAFVHLLNVYLPPGLLGGLGLFDG